MFKTVQNRGFQMVFENGWTISVQFGPGNYSDARSFAPGDYDAPMKTKDGVWQSPNAEIAIWDAQGNWHEFENGDTVKGWCTPNEVAEWIEKISNKK